MNFKKISLTAVLLTLIFSFQTSLADIGTLDTAQGHISPNFNIDGNANTGFIAQTFWGNGETINTIDIVAARVSGIPTADLRARIFSGVTASTTNLQYTTDWTLEASTTLPAASVHSRDDDGQYATTTFTLSTPFTTDSTKFYALVIDTTDHDSGGVHSSPYYDVITTDGTADFYTGGTFGMQQSNPASGFSDCYRETTIRFGSISCGVYGYDYGAMGDMAFELHTTPATTTEVVCTTDCNSNVLFLPGAGGSRLYAPKADCIINCEDQIWTPNADSDAHDLAFSSSGISNRSDIYTRDVLDWAYVGGVGNIYVSFLGDLQKLKIDNAINDYSAVPYD